MKNHKELLVWQKSMDQVELVYSLAKKLPKEEMYALSDQLRRAAVSVPSNIAEGNARETDKEFSRFLLIAQGSNSELETQLLICRRLQYLSQNETESALILNEEIAKMLRALMKSIKG